MNDIRRLVPWGIALLSIVLYLPTLTQGFISVDDPLFITENPLVTMPTAAGALTAFTGFTGFLYIPLTTVSWQLTSAIAGIQPWAFHLGDILLHAACAVLVYLIAKRLLPGKLWLAVGAGLVFAVHPINTEAVVWASSRKDLLSSLFALASLLSFLRYLDGDEQSTWKSLGLFALSLLSKTTAVLLPLVFVVLLLQRKEFTSENKKQLLPFALLAVAFAALAVWGGQQFLSGPTPLMLFLYGLQSMGLIVGNILVPAQLTPMHYVSYGENLLTPWTAVGALVLFLLVVTIWIGVRKRSWHLAAFGSAFFLVLLLPTFGTIQKGGLLFVTSDKYAYLPLLGILLVQASIAAWLARHVSSYLNHILGFAAFGIILLAVPTVFYQRVWADDEALFTRALETHPDNPAALNGLALTEAKKGKRENALALYEQSQTVAPGYAAAFINQAELYWNMGNEDAFVKTTGELIASLSGPDLDRSPGMQQALTVFAEKIRTNIGKPALALALLEKAQTISPESPYFPAGLGATAFDAGDKKRAKPLLELAEQNGSRDPLIYYRLAEIYSDENKTDEVIRVMKKGISFDPENQIAKDQLKKVEAAQ